jgi:hypothetical protein
MGIKAASVARTILILLTAEQCCVVAQTNTATTVVTVS